MHFKNKRPAQNGDPVIAKNYQGKVVVGSIFNLNPGSQTCNCDVAVIIPGGTQVLTCQTVGQLYHAEDALAAVEAANQAPAAEAPVCESPAAEVKQPYAGP